MSLPGSCCTIKCHPTGIKHGITGKSVSQWMAFQVWWKTLLLEESTQYIQVRKSALPSTCSCIKLRVLLLLTCCALLLVRFVKLIEKPATSIVYLKNCTVGHQADWGHHFILTTTQAEKPHCYHAANMRCLRPCAAVYASTEEILLRTSNIVHSFKSLESSWLLQRTCSTWLSL